MQVFEFAQSEEIAIEMLKEGDKDHDGTVSDYYINQYF